MNELFLIFLPKKEKEWFIFTKKRKREYFYQNVVKKWWKVLNFQNWVFKVLFNQMIQGKT